MNAVQAALAAAAFTGITDGVGKGMESIGASLKAFGAESCKQKHFVAAAFAGAAWVVKVLNYYQEQLVKL
jgi:hypothetical protein